MTHLRALEEGDAKIGAVVAMRCDSDVEFVITAGAGALAVSPTSGVQIKVAWLDGNIQFQQAVLPLAVFLLVAKADEDIPAY